MTTPSFFLRVAGAIAACVFQSLSAATVYQENFDGAADVLLNGTAPDTGSNGAVWTASTNTGSSGPAIFANGTINASSGASAWLPFAVDAGHVYTVTAVVNNVVWQSGSGTPAGVGFTSDSPLSAAAVNTGTSGDHAILQARRGGSWAFFEGPVNNGTATASAGNNTLFTSSATSENPINNFEIKLVLDTTGTNWTVAGYFGGTQVDLNGESMGLLFTYETNPTVTGVGISYGSSSFVFDSFTVEAVAAVPEPATVALLLGLGAMGRASCRRRREAV